MSAAAPAAAPGPYETLIVRREGSVEWITLNRPDRLNAINQQMIEELHGHLQALSRDWSARVIVLSGAGRGFCAGMDIRERQAGGPATAPADDGPGPSLAGIIRLLRSCPQPVISLIGGAACGGGFALALASDIRIAGHSARMNDAFITLGISGCELGLSYFLPRIVGLSHACEIMYTGEFISAATAFEIGLASRLVPDAELESSARALIASMLKASPQGLRGTKATLNQALGLTDLGTVIDLEERMQALCMKGPQFQAALAAFGQRQGDAR